MDKNIFFSQANLNVWHLILIKIKKYKNSGCQNLIGTKNVTKSYV